MATKKSPSRASKSRRPRTRSLSPLVSSTAIPSRYLSLLRPLLKSRFPLKFVLIVLLGISVFFLAKRYRGLVIAGTVNKSIISRWQLNDTLTRRYGQAVLDELINEKLLNEFARQESITLTPADIDAEIQKLTDSLGGQEQLNAALQQYGLSQADLNNQVRIRLLQQRLAAKLFPVSVSDEEVQQYFKDNSFLYKDKKFEEVKDEIKSDLEQQKLQQEFSAWFQEKKSAAPIQTYI